MDNIFLYLGFAFLRVLRTLRLFRPLRLISRNDSLKIVVKTMIHSLPAMFGVILISLLVFLIFGLIGVSLFQGKMNYCSAVDLEPFSLPMNTAPLEMCVPSDRYIFSRIKLHSYFNSKNTKVVNIFLTSNLKFSYILSFCLI